MVTFEIIEIGAVPGVLKRDWNKVARAAFLKAGKWWQRKILPGHFKRSAISKYRYKPRDGDVGSRTESRLVKRVVDGKEVFRRVRSRRTYTSRKKKRWGHALPLVWSGESRALSGTGRVTATARGGGATFRVRIPAPKLNRRQHMRDEVTRVIPEEIQEMTKIINGHIQSTFARMRQRKKTKL